MVQLRRRCKFRRRIDAGLVALVVFWLTPALVWAETPDTSPVQLQLDVSVNGYPLNLIAAFSKMPDGHIASSRSELLELGVAVPGDGAPGELINLESIKGLSYVFDDSAQTIELELPDAQRLAKDLSATAKTDFPEAQSDTGLVLNYSAFASANYKIAEAISDLDGASLNLDARAFSSYGALQQTGIVGTTTFSDMTAVRLDSVWSYADQDKLRSYRLGDIVSGSLRWTRPVRMGGGQVQRNFDLRPDLVTMPLPSLEGTAAVPSTVDVFIGNVKAYSQSVAPGPFRVDNIPAITSNGTVRMVLTDTTGRQTETESPFFTSPDLLKENLYDYSIDMGVVRRSYGTLSFDYATEPVGLASLRYGISDIVTGEAHVEASASLLDAGVGGLASIGEFGMLSGAVAGSMTKHDKGIFVYAGWEATFGDLGIQASTRRTFGNYQDLAAISEKPLNGASFFGGVPRALDQASLSYGFPDLGTGLGLSLIHQKKMAGDRSLIVTANITETFKNNLTVFASGFSDFAGQGEYGAFVGFSMPLGETISTSSGLSVSKGHWTAVAEASHAPEAKPGSYGWRVAHGEGDQRYTAADGSYHGTKAVIEGHILEQNGNVGGHASVDGAIVATRAGMFLGNHIGDSFAVVDAGAEGVDVEYENRFAGKTGKSGKLLLSQLRAYQKNKIAINVNDLPLNAIIPQSEAIVVPREMSGVVVDFGVKKDAPSALVVLTDAGGKNLAEGSEITLNENAEPFIMGYDGQVYLTDVNAANTITANVNGTTCKASFDFVADNAAQTTIGPLQCL